MQTTNRNFGATLLVAGTTIGAGMLALPISTATLGFPLTVAMMAGFWLIMLYGATLYVRLCRVVAEPISLPTLCQKLGLPKLLPVISTILCFLFYALIAAYLTGGSSILHKFLPIKLQKLLTLELLICILAFVFAIIIVGHRHWSDYLNRFMVVVKMLAFFTMLALLLPLIDKHRLSHGNGGLLQTAEFWQSIPIIFSSFGFHGSIPSILRYIGIQNPRINQVLFWGSAIPYIVYILWVGTIIGVLPLTGVNSFATIAEQGQDVGMLVSLLGVFSHSPALLGLACAAFSLLAITTSLFGVGLGLFDFFQERFVENNSKLKSIVATFIIPLLFALFYPKGFILAFGFAAIALALLALVIPCILCLYLGKSFPLRFKGEKLLIIATILVGTAIIIIEIGSVIFG